MTKLSEKALWELSSDRKEVLIALYRRTGETPVAVMMASEEELKLKG